MKFEKDNSVPSVEVYIVPVRGYFCFEKNADGEITKVFPIDAMRTDIFSTGEEITYGVSLLEDVNRHELFTQRGMGFEQHIEEKLKRNEIYNTLYLDHIKRLSREFIDTELYECVKDLVDELEHNGVRISNEVIDYLQSLYDVNVKSGLIERKVCLVETGQKFASIKECSEKLQIPFDEIADAIFTHKEIDKVHFALA